MEPLWISSSHSPEGKKAEGIQLDGKALRLVFTLVWVRKWTEAFLISQQSWGSRKETKSSECFLLVQIVDEYQFRLICWTLSLPSSHSANVCCGKYCVHILPVQKPRLTPASMFKYKPILHQLTKQQQQQQHNQHLFVEMICNLFEL